MGWPAPAAWPLRLGSVWAPNALRFCRFSYMSTCFLNALWRCLNNPKGCAKPQKKEQSHVLRRHWLFETHTSGSHVALPCCSVSTRRGTGAVHFLLTFPSHRTDTVHLKPTQCPSDSSLWSAKALGRINMGSEQNLILSSQLLEADHLCRGLFPT